MIIDYRGLTFIVQPPNGATWSSNPADLLAIAIAFGLGNSLDPVYDLLIAYGEIIDGTYIGPPSASSGGSVSNNTPSSGTATPPPGVLNTKLNIRGYRDIIWAIQFWKQSIVLEYREVEFRFKNTGLGNNGAAKLTISGIVPDLRDGSGRGPDFGSKEYTIYSELRGINLERWNVKVPWVFDTSANYNVLENNNNIPYYFKLIGGIGYTNLNEYSPATFVDGGELPIFETVTSTGTNASITFEFQGALTDIASSRRLRQSINELVGTYGEHPMLVFYNSNTSANPTNKKFYNVLPIGIDKYKVNLTLANGEAVTRFFDINWNPISA